jgi:hypothetical protein
MNNQVFHNNKDHYKYILNLNEDYASDQKIPYTKTHQHIIFDELESNFHPFTWKFIQQNPHYLEIAQLVTKNRKTSEIYGVCQLHNSTTAMIMNLMCNPFAHKVFDKHVEAFGFSNANSFQFLQEFALETNCEKPKHIRADFVDLKSEHIFFTNLNEKLHGSFRHFDYYRNIQGIEDVFNLSKPIQVSSSTIMFINGLLLSALLDKKVFFILDYRKPYLLQRYLDIIRSLRKTSILSRTGIVFWQNLIRHHEKSIKSYFLERFGIFAS